MKFNQRYINHVYIEDFLRGRINESFFENNEQYKNMAKEIIKKELKDN